MVQPLAGGSKISAINILTQIYEFFIQHHTEKLSNANKYFKLITFSAFLSHPFYSYLMNFSLILITIALPDAHFNLWMGPFDNGVVKTQKTHFVE